MASSKFANQNTQQNYDPKHLEERLTIAWDNDAKDQCVNDLHEKLLKDKHYNDISNFAKQESPELHKRAMTYANNQLAENSQTLNTEEGRNHFHRQQYISHVVPSLILLKPKNASKLIKNRKLETDEILASYISMLENQGKDGEKAVFNFLTVIDQDISENNTEKQLLSMRGRLPDMYASLAGLQNSFIVTLIKLLCEMQQVPEQTSGCVRSIDDNEATGPSRSAVRPR